MNKRHRFLVPVCGSILTTCFLQIPIASAAPVEIRFDGDSTLHTFSGEVASDEVEVKTAADGQETVEITVSVLNMKTGHEGRDGKMYDMFSAEHFAAIRGSASLGMLRDPKQDIIPIDLVIRGQARTIEAQRETADHTPDKIKLSWTVSLKSFGLEAPTVMGLIRVYDDVKVFCELDVSALNKTDATPSLEPH